MSYGVVCAILCFGLPLTERMEAGWSPFKDLPPPRGRGAATDRARLALAGRRARARVAASLVGALSGAAFYQSFTPGALPANLVLVPWRCW